jgi:hypothetical protein
LTVRDEVQPKQAVAAVGRRRTRCPLARAAERRYACPLLLALEQGNASLLVRRSERIGSAGGCTRAAPNSPQLGTVTNERLRVMPSLVRPVDIDRLRDLGTRELLGLLRRLRACEESIEVSDATPGEVDPAIIRFKNDPRWLQLDRAVRAVLATREHVPGGKERAAARVKRTKAQRTNERRAGRPANRVSGSRTGRGGTRQT